MNLFITDRDPAVCAEALDDARLVKAVVEAAQMLTTAAHVNGFALSNDVFKPTHATHPCVKWVAEKSQNYNWTYRYFLACAAEYTKRFHRTHACERHAATLGEGCNAAAVGDPPRFYNGARNNMLRLDFTSLPVFDAYKAYLRARWNTDRRPPRWTGGKQPSWR